MKLLGSLYQFLQITLLCITHLCDGASFDVVGSMKTYQLDHSLIRYFLPMLCKPNVELEPESDISYFMSVSFNKPTVCYRVDRHKYVLHAIKTLLIFPFASLFSLAFVQSLHSKLSLLQTATLPMRSSLLVPKFVLESATRMPREGWPWLTSFAGPRNG